MKIVLAQIGYTGTQQAETLDDVVVGIKIPWIELDGTRLTDIVGVEFRAGNVVGQTFMTVELIGPLEIVYVDEDGEPLGSVEMTPEDAVAAGRIDYRSMIERPGTEEP